MVKKLGRIMVENRAITEMDLAIALSTQVGQRSRLGEVLVNMGVPKYHIWNALVEQLIASATAVEGYHGVVSAR